MKFIYLHEYDICEQLHDKESQVIHKERTDITIYYSQNILPLYVPNILSQLWLLIL